jgi:signal transduction histidine kinase
MDSHTLSPEVQVARLEMVLELSRTLHATLDLNTLLKSVVEAASELTDSETACILLLDQKTGQLYLEATTGKQLVETERVIIPVEDSLAGWIIQNGESLVVDNIFGDGSRLNEVDSLSRFEVRAILGAPLKLTDKSIGVLEVFNKRLDASFTSDDIHMLTTLAAQAAVAIENARLFEQSDAVARVVHELRSPVTSILDFSRLMLASPEIDVEDLRLGLESVNQEAMRLAQMVNNFLDLTRLESGRIGLEKQTLDLGSLAQEVIDQFFPQALERNITLSLKTPDDFPEIKGDVSRLRQAMTSLIDNAIKYNREGGLVEITLSYGHVRVQVSVRDTGLGIAPADLELIFNKFYRVKQEADKPSGAGLGLSMARQLIQAHGGDIWVESQVGVGSCFTFSLPIG